MKIHCMIVDDEPLAINALELLLSKLDDFEVTAALSDAMQAFQVLQKESIDLIFLDIDMPELSGLEFLRSLKHPPSVIFVTAYRDYAFDAFELDVVDYLLKPVSFERLLQACEKYYQKRALAKEVSVVPGEDQDERAILQVKADRKVLRLPLKEITFIESMRDYLQIHLVHKTVLCKMSLKDLQNTLPEPPFIRIHKSFVINTHHVHSFSGNHVEIEKHQLPIGRSYKSAVMSALNYTE